MVKMVLVLVPDSDHGDPRVFESVDAFRRCCEREGWIRNGDPEEWEREFQRLRLGEDWSDEAGAVVWREVEG